MTHVNNIFHNMQLAKMIMLNISASHFAYASLKVRILKVKLGTFKNEFLTHVYHLLVLCSTFLESQSMPTTSASPKSLSNLVRHLVKAKSNLPKKFIRQEMSLTGHKSLILGGGGAYQVAILFGLPLLVILTLLLLIVINE